MVGIVVNSAPTTGRWGIWHLEGVGKRVCGRLGGDRSHGRRPVGVDRGATTETFVIFV